MKKTERYRQQNNEMLEIATEISSYLQEVRISNEASKVRSLLSRLLAKLKIHLAMEDKSLYPALLHSGDQNVISLTKSFMVETKEMGEELTAYQKKWASAHHIQNSPQDFIEHTKGMFGALKMRIERENNELYVAADAI